jgi:hypothetical protein
VTGGPDLTFNGGNADVFIAKVVEVSPADYLPLVLRGN